MDISLFDYNLPEELIAKFPPAVRGQSRLMVINRATGQFEHKHYQDMLDYFEAGDVLVLNNTRVAKQRVKFFQPGKTKPVELLFLYPLSQDQLTWEVKVGNARALKHDNILTTPDHKISLRVDYDQAANSYRVQFLRGAASELFANYGEVPIPPYLKREQTKEDEIRYNTVFAKAKGSVAAPTASLNMTEQLLAKLKVKGVVVVELTLDVNWGTFAPVKTSNLLEHKIHAEHFSLSAEVAETINTAKRAGHKIFALGTTVTRVLETCATKAGTVEAKSGWTEIFIYPGYQWRMVDRLITNFHVPKSTLLALVSAFASRELILQAYHEAIKENYQFLSYGDSMLIL